MVIVFMPIITMPVRYTHIAPLRTYIAECRWSNSTNATRPHRGLNSVGVRVCVVRLVVIRDSWQASVGMLARLQLAPTALAMWGRNAHLRSSRLRSHSPCSKKSRSTGGKCIGTFALLGSVTDQCRRGRWDAVDTSLLCSRPAALLVLGLNVSTSSGCRCTINCIGKLLQIQKSTNDSNVLKRST